MKTTAWFLLFALVLNVESAWAQTAPEPTSKPMKAMGVHIGVGYYQNSAETESQSLFPRQELGQGTRFDLSLEVNVVDLFWLGLHYINTGANSDLEILGNSSTNPTGFRERQKISQQYAGILLAKGAEIANNLHVRPHVSAGLLIHVNTVDSAGYRFRLLGPGLGMDAGFSLQYFLTDDFSVTLAGSYFLSTVYGLQYLTGRYQGAQIYERYQVSHYRLSLGLSYYPIHYPQKGTRNKKRSKNKTPDWRFR